MSETTKVNQHYLDHVVELSRSSEIEASEDILAANGMKLIAKGAKIDPRVRERLLQHKLTKPLEQTIRVVDGVATAELSRTASRLIEQHPLLSRLCGEAAGRFIVTAMRNLATSHEVGSLLSVYSGQGEHKLDHAVGIALIAAAMSEEVQARLDVSALMLAGLLHDVGELYIDPAILNADRQLNPQEWKHVAAHPVVGAHVLKGLNGAGPQIATSVLHHHERLDGFGYPQGLRADGIPMPGHLLAVAEVLMGIVESGREPAQRADVALKLLPGEFDGSLRNRVVTAARAAPSDPGPAEVDQVGRRIVALAGNVHQLRDLVGLARQDRPASTAFKALLSEAAERAERICAAFSSTGLEFHGVEHLLEQLEQLDKDVLLEMSIVSRELLWRVGELQRRLITRAEQLPAQDAAQVRRLIETWHV